MVFKHRHLALLLLTATLACGDDDHDDGVDQAELEGLQKCCHLGEVCHEGDTGTESESGPCHDLGHQNDPDACTEMYAACLAICVPEGESQDLPEICEDPDADGEHEEGSTHD